ncbi:WD repeat-containing protein WRAP73 isoform 2-T2 [Molossus nigricans]
MPRACPGPDRLWRASASVTSGRGLAIKAGSWGSAARRGASGGGTMNFSEVFKLSNQLCKFSPDGKYLASCVQYRLVVREVNSLQILRLYTCLDQVQHVEWSADSLFILCAMYKRGLVQVWSLEQPEWHCRIDEGSAGLVASCWSPDGRHVLNTTEFHLRVTVWSLCTKSVSYIKYPKACPQGITFSRDGRYLALAERRDCKDYVSIFVCSDWQLLRHFDTDTQDLAGIEWAPNGCVLAAWDTCLEYKVLLYSLDGRLLAAYCAYEWSLGIKAVTWSPSSQFLAVGSYDGKVRILNHVTWKVLTEFGHPAAVSDPRVQVLGDSRGHRPQMGALSTEGRCGEEETSRWGCRDSVRPGGPGAAWRVRTKRECGAWVPASHSCPRPQRTCVLGIPFPLASGHRCSGR